MQKDTKRCKKIQNNVKSYKKMVKLAKSWYTIQKNVHVAKSSKRRKMLTKDCKI